jgi:hypothetical protein
MPSVLIYKIIFYISNGLFFIDYQKESIILQIISTFTFDNFRNLAIFASISFSFKCVILILLDIFVINGNNIYNCIDKNSNIIRKTFSLMNNRPMFRRLIMCFGVPLLVTFEDGSHEIEIPTEFQDDCIQRDEHGYYNIKDGRYELNNQITALPDTSLGNELRVFDILNRTSNVFIKVSDNLAMYFGVFKLHCTDLLLRQLKFFTVPDFPQDDSIRDTIFENNEDLKRRMTLVRKARGNRRQTSFEFITPVLNHYFNQGYEIEQRRFHVEMSFSMRKLFPDGNNKTVIFINSAPLQHKTSIMDQLAGSISHIKTNTRNDVWLILTRGTYMTIGLVIRDFHKINGFNNKCVLFDGFISFQTHPDLKIRPVPQTNDIFPNIRFYNVGIGDSQNNMSVHVILDQIAKHNGYVERDPTLIDFGPNLYIDQGARIKDWSEIEDIDL